jgi:hypothetical protein
MHAKEKKKREAKLPGRLTLALPRSIFSQFILPKASLIRLTVLLHRSAFLVESTHMVSSHPDGMSCEGTPGQNSTLRVILPKVKFAANNQRGKNGNHEGAFVRSCSIRHYREQFTPPGPEHSMVANIWRARRRQGI